MYIFLPLCILYVWHDLFTGSVLGRNKVMLKKDLPFVNVLYLKGRKRKNRRNAKLQVGKQHDYIAFNPMDGGKKGKVLLKKRHSNLHKNTHGKEDHGNRGKGQFFKNICALINLEHDEKTKELQRLKINNYRLVVDRINCKDVNGYDFYGKQSEDAVFEKREITQLVEAYWLTMLRDRCFFSFLKNKKSLIFSVSAGVDSLSLLYSFLFVIYKIVVTISKKKDTNNVSLENEINSVYTYTHEDIDRIIYSNNVPNIFFFTSILKKITVLYCNHKTRVECNEERKFLRDICKKHDLKFKMKILTKSNLHKLRRKEGHNQENIHGNNFLQLARMWRRNSYVDLSNQICKESSTNANEVKGARRDDINATNGEQTDTLERGLLPREPGRKWIKYTYKEYISDVDNCIRKTYKKNIVSILLKRKEQVDGVAHLVSNQAADGVANLVSNQAADGVANLVSNQAADGVADGAASYRYFRQNRTRGSRKIKSVVFIGHHNNDNNETVLFQFFRGVYIKNLKGIKFLTHLKNCLLYRPFLKLSKISLYNYMISIKKKWMFDLSNEKLCISRNFLRNVVIPNISLVLKNKRDVENSLDTFSKKSYNDMIISESQINYNKEFPIKNAEKNKMVNEHNRELQNCHVYIYPSLDKRLKNLMSQINSVEKHLTYYSNMFKNYIMSKYYGYRDSNSNDGTIFMEEYTKMQDKIYNSFFFGKNMNNLIRINRIMYENNFFFKIFNFLEFLLLPSKLIRIEVLYDLILKNTNVRLSYSHIERVYESIFSFVSNYLNSDGNIKRTPLSCSSFPSFGGKCIGTENHNHGARGEHVHESTEMCQRQGEKQKYKVININSRNKILVHNYLFRILNRSDEERNTLNSSIRQYKEKSSIVYIYDDLSAEVTRMNIKNVPMDGLKNSYLIIKKRKKKKKEKFHIHIRYLRKEDYIYYEKKMIKATKFLSTRNIPYIYKYALPVVEISNFKKNCILFFFLFQELKNEYFSVRQSVHKKNAKNYFIYSVKFGYGTPHPVFLKTALC
ncbi:conserved Plasmodium protein, unknown function [Plasmodium ovale wallikeri]|uniref:tRNA(Ile)-lysidine/2-thiocytidine synthase N-terminal domain-containing protein n=1 Tax=Plasmodium ovale wallikeri TaxID=864142 RepID=A0A1A8YJS9_PLAOA|nr:conserved Plasmodium protein, unknown function [Plasmodium ovale wallikeri]